jgi:hypothetical protein
MKFIICHMYGTSEWLLLVNGFIKYKILLWHRKKVHDVPKSLMFVSAFITEGDACSSTGELIVLLSVYQGYTYRNRLWRLGCWRTNCSILCWRWCWLQSQMIVTPTTTAVMWACTKIGILLMRRWWVVKIRTTKFTWEALKCNRRLKRLNESCLINQNWTSQSGRILLYVYTHRLCKNVSRNK